jgi:hypothetical protein
MDEPEFLDVKWLSGSNSSMIRKTVTFVQKGYLKGTLTVLEELESEEHVSIRVAPSPF